MEQQNNNYLQEEIRHISHEIRNNLSICDVYSEIIKKHLTKEGISNQSIDNAINCIQNAVKLIGNSLMELKGLENTSVQILESHKLISESVQMSEAYITDKEIKIINNANEFVKIYADEYKLKACLINLIKNAIEAIDKKGIITISTKKIQDNLLISISNNGPEIPENIKSELFKDGFTTKQKGAGIGLYLSKRNLETFDGTLYLNESNKTLTEFIIKLKAVD